MCSPVSGGWLCSDRSGLSVVEQDGVRVYVAGWLLSRHDLRPVRRDCGVREVVQIFEIDRTDLAFGRRSRGAAADPRPPVALVASRAGG